VRRPPPGPVPPVASLRSQSSSSSQLGKDYEVITADERLDKIAQDFVEHCATRWEAGKSLFICIDKITCARMHQRIIPRWKAKAAQVRAAFEAKRSEAAATA
jgi:type I restriction enzyme, R subunit